MYFMLPKGLPPIETLGDIVSLAIVILLFAIFSLSLFMLVYLLLNWLIVNIVRRCKHATGQEDTIVIQQSSLDKLSKQIKDIRASKKIIDELLNDIDDN